METNLIFFNSRDQLLRIDIAKIVYFEAGTCPRVGGRNGHRGRGDDGKQGAHDTQQMEAMAE